MPNNAAYLPYRLIWILLDAPFKRLHTRFKTHMPFLTKNPLIYPDLIGTAMRWFLHGNVHGKVSSSDSQQVTTEVPLKQGTKILTVTP